LEKRINGDLHALAEKVNASGVGGYRLLPVPGQVFTELEAVNFSSGANAELFAAGGVCGAEGSCWLAVAGTKEQEEEAEKIFASVAHEPQFNLDSL